VDRKGKKGVGIEMDGEESDLGGCRDATDISSI